MLVDVIRAETAKLLRNRATAFWAFGFVSVLSLILNLVAYFYTRGKLPPGVERPVDLAQMTLSGVSQAAGPLTLLFCLMGAATIFAGEYRWETWRLMTPRATRTQLWLGKVVVFAAAVAVSIVLLGLASLITGLVQLAMGDATAPARGELGEYLWRLSSSFLMSWIRILQFGALAALVGVATRSLLAAVLVPIVIVIGQSLAQSLLGSGMVPIKPWMTLLLPGRAADTVAAALSSAGDAVTGSAGGQELVLALVTLALWIGAGLFGALALFRRQDLARE